MDEALEKLLQDFSLEELLEEGQLPQEDALKSLFYQGLLDIHHLLPEFPDGLGEEETP